MDVINAYTDSLDFYQSNTVLILQIEKQFLQLCPGLWTVSSFEAMAVVFGDSCFTTEMTCYYSEGTVQKMVSLGTRIQVTVQLVVSDEMWTVAKTIANALFHQQNQEWNHRETLSVSTLSI